MSKEEKKKTGIWALIIKLGSKLLTVLGKLTKALKMTKVGLAALSFAGYAAIYSWKFALLLLISIGIHESGHVWAMKKVGIKTKGFYFLPFIGGAAVAEESYSSYAQNSFVSIMGPIWGAGLSILSCAAYYITQNPFWAATSAWIAAMNIFNLLPVTPLDGGQLIRSIAFSINRGVGLLFLIASIILGALIMFKLKIGLFALILIVGSLELFIEIWYRNKLKQFKDGKLKIWQLPSGLVNEHGEVKAYPKKMAGYQMLLSIISYVGTIAVLVIVLFLTKGVPGGNLAANFLE